MQAHNWGKMRVMSLLWRNFTSNILSRTIFMSHDKFVRIALTNMLLRCSCQKIFVYPLFHNSVLIKIPQSADLNPISSLKLKIKYGTRQTLVRSEIIRFVKHIDTSNWKGTSKRFEEMPAQLMYVIWLFISQPLSLKSKHEILGGTSHENHIVSNCFFHES